MIGKQILIDLDGCDRDVIDNEIAVERCATEIAKLLDATIIKLMSHKFTPQGLTCVAIISTSHIVIHTWPERGLVTVDVFSCAPNTGLEGLGPMLAIVFRGHSTSVRLVERGREEERDA